MCHDLDSRPPIAPIAGGALDGAPTVLHAADGADLAAFRAQPATASDTAIVILPDIRGLHPFYEELALRFAEAGVAAVTIDYFGRTAGTGPRDADFDPMAHIAQTNFDTLSLDIAAAAKELRRAPAVSKVFSIGFCFGGRLSFLSGGNADLGLAGVIGFYGGPAGQGRGGMGSPTDVADQFGCPVLGLFGGADEGIPQADIDGFGAALTAAGVENELVTYPGAPHSFFDRKTADFADASSDAWQRVLEFVGQPAASTNR